MKSLNKSADLLCALVLLPDRLLCMLRGIEVYAVKILNAWHQIFQRVASHLVQGLGLRSTTLVSLCLQIYQYISPHTKLKLS